MVLYRETASKRFYKEATEGSMTMVIENQSFDEERALYNSHGVTIRNCSFDGPADGESACKESSQLTVENCYSVLA